MDHQNVAAALALSRLKAIYGTDPIPFAALLGATLFEMRLQDFRDRIANIPTLPDDAMKTD